MNTTPPVDEPFSREEMRKLAEQIEWLKGAYVSAVKLDQQDVLCVFCPGAISDAVAVRLKEQMEATFAGNRVAVLGDGLRLGVLHREQQGVVCLECGGPHHTLEHKASTYEGTSAVITDFATLPRLLRQLLEEYVKSEYGVTAGEMTEVLTFIEWLEKRGE